MIIVLHVLTAVLIVLKLMGLIAISWWLVVAPSAFAIVFAFVIVTGLVALGLWAEGQPTYTRRK